MRKYALILTLLIALPLIAQEADIQNENIMTGLILAVESNRINFEEAWLPIRFIAKQRSIVVSNADDESIGLNNLTAPCLVKLTFQYIEDEIVPVKVKILKQYQYDSEGLIKETMMD